jgi:hypothetical protein
MDPLIGTGAARRPNRAMNDALKESVASRDHCKHLSLSLSTATANERRIL